MIVLVAMAGVVLTYSNLGIVFAQGNALKSVQVESSISSSSKKATEKDLNSKTIKDDAVKDKAIKITLSSDQISINDEFDISIILTEKTLSGTIHGRIPDKIEVLTKKTQDENKNVYIDFDEINRELSIAPKDVDGLPENIRIFLKSLDECSGVFNILSEDRDIISNDLELKVIKDTDSAGDKTNPSGEEKDADEQSQDKDQGEGQDQSQSQTQEQEQDDKNEQNPAKVAAVRALDTAEVSSWLEFQSAYNNQSITHIILKKDIVATGSVYYTRPRENDIEISGVKTADSHYKLTFPHYYSAESTGMQSSDLPIYDNKAYQRSQTESNTRMFKLHDVEILSDGNWDPHERFAERSGNALIGSALHEETNERDSYKDAAGWKFEFRNISTNKNLPIPRLIYAFSQVTIGGKVELYTLNTAMDVGSLYFEPDVQYESKIVSNMASNGIYFPGKDENGIEGQYGYKTTGDSRNFELARAAKVKITSIGPIVDRATKHFIINQDAQLYGYTGVNATIHLEFGSKLDPTTFDAYDGSVVDLRAYDPVLKKGNCVMWLKGENTEVTFHPGSTFITHGYSQGNSGGDQRGAIGFSQYTNATTRFVLDNPKYFDIANRAPNGNWIYKPTQDSIMEIIDSDEYIWETKPGVPGHLEQAADYNFHGVHYVGVRGIEINTNIELGVSTYPVNRDLEKALKKHVARISNRGNSISEELTFTVPRLINFGTIKYNANVGLNKKLAEPLASTSELSVIDTHTDKVDWKLSAQEKTPLTNAISGRKIENAMAYLDNGVLKPIVSASPVLIMTHKNIDTVYNISGTTWDGISTGVCLDYHGLPIEKGTYDGVIEWTLLNVGP
jgi:hypothetical protein